MTEGSSVQHSNLVNKILLNCIDSRTRLWKNHVGVGLPYSEVKKAFDYYHLQQALHHIPKIKYGVTGSADIMGLRSIIITPDMVGKIIGQIVYIECKTGNAVQSKQQKAFEKMVTTLGGFYKVVRDKWESFRW